MPKNTFFNLPAGKKERVLSAAIDEFASYSYHKASISRIVEKAEIAKGSFYQYFENKQDLFKYIIEQITEKKMEYMYPVLEKMEDLNFFQILREIYISAIKFVKDHPRLEEIGTRLFKQDNNPVLEELIDEQMPRSDEFFADLLKKGQQQGDVDTDIDIRLTSHMLTTMNMSIAEFIYEDGKVNMDDMVFIDKMLYVLENGLKNDDKD